MASGGEGEGGLWGEREGGGWEGGGEVEGQGLWRCCGGGEGGCEEEDGREVEGGKVESHCIVLG